MRKKRPQTKMVRIRIADIERSKSLKKHLQKKGPDFWAELIKNYHRWHR